MFDVGDLVKLNHDLGNPGDRDYVPAGVTGEVTNVTSGLWRNEVRFSSPYLPWLVNDDELTIVTRAALRLA